ncbi:MAG: putative arsenical pump-driving ATPase [Methanosaeta sp. PtaB.Bin039]|mgnify:CR=1 FL=1|nr:MAG: putative arsenical pump-driving ATPase [Methanosaeta sp. PtaB.Bin039]OPY44326.1 MAG: putative arsenical pump-driving ATPase [Methanosaeta sp. PtaU1.Bin028]HOT06506.1 TRC40/GET3/ArsA family transport-energizing ATPase [Methanotrichaceae archaeon]HQF15621.1 TRC40/GET3/ArsA family transport-energizing ATPase [Methanotrichaceae archaeon]HQI90357.1 TRC40/GET3/ArsA family transport-energizing ATPase [Methanotrichaceae archaeon]
MRLIYVAGKGGVGKSVCSASTALWSAGQGKETLVFSMDPAHSLSDILESELGDSPAMIGQHLSAYEPSVEKEARIFFSRYRHMFNALFSLFEVEVRPQDMAQFPGVAEMVFMDRLYDVYMEGMYEVVVIDSAPTAMVLPLLQLPAVTTGLVSRMLGIKNKWMGLLNMLEPGFGDSIVSEARRLRIKAETMRNALLDKSTASLTVVTIPEKAAVMETVRLIETVESHGVTVDSMIINHVLGGDCQCQFCRRKRDSQADHMATLKRMYAEKRIACLLDQGGEVRGSTLDSVAQELYGQGQLRLEP